MTTTKLGTAMNAFRLYHRPQSAAGRWENGHDRLTFGDWVMRDGLYSKVP